MNVTKFLGAALAIAATAALAFGQSADKTTIGKYKIAVVSPNEGDSIAADQVNVVLTPSTTAMGDSKTQVDVFLDDQQKGVINANETEFRVEGVKPGPHKLVLIARNPVTDAQFDRREINFVATGSGSTTTGVSSVSENAVGAHVPPAVSSTERQHSYTATTATQSAQNDLSASQQSSSASSSTSSSSSYSGSTYAPPPSSPSSSYSAPVSTDGNTTNDNARLPQTASSDALLALAGAALVVTGALLRRAA